MYPCEAEIASACPDSPKSEVAACLKDPGQHDNPTEISSECTDFMALNTACAEELEQLCEEEFYSHETVPCLTKYNTAEEEESISDKCKSVMKWALPSEEEVPEEEKVTDELGMTDQDRQEKEEWRAKRKAGREAAMDRMKQKEVDAKKEKERAELEKFKEEDPEGYQTMLAQQEEEKRQQREQKKRERLLQAAMERKKREAAGASDDEDASAAKRPKKGKKQAGGSWAGLLFKVLAGAGFVGLGYAVYSGMTKGSGGGGGGRSSGKGKKKRG